jgi:hypothetical protein
MVKEIKHNNKTYFQCEECMMYYLDLETAKKCEDFCRKHNACNTEIISKAVQLGG